LITRHSNSSFKFKLFWFTNKYQSSNRASSAIRRSRIAYFGGLFAHKQIALSSYSNTAINFPWIWLIARQLKLSFQLYTLRLTNNASQALENRIHPHKVQFSQVMTDDWMRKLSFQKLLYVQKKASDHKIIDAAIIIITININFTKYITCIF